MAEEQWNSNDLQYESLSEDEADKRENENHNGGAITECSVRPEKEKGTKRKRSKAWDTFDFYKGENDEGHTVKCKKCSYTIGYNSSFGTGNMLKHQKICASSSDIRQLIISKSQGTMMVRNGAFDPKIFRDMITDAVVRHNLPLQDVPTRWNSTYLMLESALYYRKAFTHLQLSDSNYKHGLEDAEWDKIEGICKFLGVFYNVTRLFSGTKYPTANLYFPNVFIVQHTLKKAVEDPNYVARSMAIKMQPKFDKYWSDYSMILAIAVVFDPRYKAQFVEFSYKTLYGVDCVQISELDKTLKGLFELYKDRIPTYTVVSESQPRSSLDHQGLDVMKEFDALDNDANSAVEKTELDRYLEEKRLTRAIEIDVLDYWSTNQARFPNLALMARDVLSIPISTVASESAFSVGGRVLDQYRSCLAHNIVESLICTHDWTTPLY